MSTKAGRAKILAERCKNCDKMRKLFCGNDLTWFFRFGEA